MDVFFVRICEGFTNTDLSLFSPLQRMTVTCTNAGSCHCRRLIDFAGIWLLLKSIDDSKLPLYGQGDFRFMRKVKVYYSSMAAKGLSHFFQKDKVDEIATSFVCTIFTVGKDSVLRFRIIIVFVLLIIV